MKKLKLNCKLQNNFYVSDKEKTSLKKNEHFAFIFKTKSKEMTSSLYLVLPTKSHLPYIYYFPVILKLCAA